MPVPHRMTAPSRVLVIVSTIVLALLLLLVSTVQAGGEVRPTVGHTVAAGDTLWDIAAEHTADGGDIRGTVALIRRINDLDTALIHPGDRLLVPVAAGEG
jgi:LysM repeat protein